MITGPTIGPAMVLHVLMRWPALIVICAIGGVGAIVYDQIGSELTGKVKEFTIETIKVDKAEPVAKDTKVLTAQVVVNESIISQQELVAVPAHALITLGSASATSR